MNINSLKIGVYLKPLCQGSFLIKSIFEIVTEIELN